MKVYKVLRRRNELVLTSFVRGYPSLTLSYAVNKKTVGVLGPILAFDTAENAQKFIDEYWTGTDVELWECEADPPAIHVCRLLVLGMLKPHRLKAAVYRWWNPIRAERSAAEYRCAPHGTVAVGSLRPIGRIMENE